MEMLSLFNISVKKNLGLFFNEIKTLDGNDRRPRVSFPGEHVYKFEWWKYPNGQASAGPSVNRHPALINE